MQCPRRVLCRRLRLILGVTDTLGYRSKKSASKKVGPEIQYVGLAGHGGDLQRGGI